MSPEGVNNQSTLSCYVARLPCDNFIVKEASDCLRFFIRGIAWKFVESVPLPTPESLAVVCTVLMLYTNLPSFS